jgi:DNA-binding SARP family transcriptional activator
MGMALMARAGRAGEVPTLPSPGSDTPIVIDEIRPRLRMVGEFELKHLGHVVELASGAQRLLAFLALKRAPVRRVHVAGTLWMDSNERRAGGNLRSALWRLRSIDGGVVQTTPTHVRISPDVQVDLDDAIAMAEAVTSPLRSIDVGFVDIAPLTLDVLVGWYDDWIVFERERFRQLRLHALESLCERQLACGLLAKAVLSALAAVSADPLRESAHRMLIKAHIAERNYGEARRQYRILSDLLMADLGIQPSEEVERIVRVLAPPI